MPQADYKVEVKPTLWEVVLEQGAYSDRDEEHHFIRANDREEAWALFKRYWADQVDNHGAGEWTRGSLLVYVDQDDHEVERFAPKKWGGYSNEDEPNYDYSYGNAWRVTLHQLSVVEFLR
ncbi:hypothetical protein [Gordonia sp. CNJ-863]|uniref:hypothetical protein n=1 Tax=Gordonia sp. CNJ-863 TaxID=1904963 RepID=UPI00111512D8|nr:hypothetical protein [Gordonia sp. CNJ-863]